jgi:hypothetical protein
VRVLAAPRAVRTKRCRGCRPPPGFEAPDVVHGPARSEAVVRGGEEGAEEVVAVEVPLAQVRGLEDVEGGSRLVAVGGQRRRHDHLDALGGGIRAIVVNRIDRAVTALHGPQAGARRSEGVAVREARESTEPAGGPKPVQMDRAAHRVERRGEERPHGGGLLEAELAQAVAVILAQVLAEQGHLVLPFEGRQPHEVNAADGEFDAVLAGRGGDVPLERGGSNLPSSGRLRRTMLAMLVPVIMTWSDHSPSTSP